MKIVMKRILPLAVAVWFGAFPLLAQQRIATVDLQKVFDKYWRREQAALALKDREQSLDKDIKGLKDDMDKIEADYHKLDDAAQDQAVTPEERAKRKALADTKLLELKTAQNTLRTAAANAHDQLLTQQKRLFDSIFSEIDAAIKAKAKDKGYALVLNTSAPSSGMISSVLYSNGENDLTDAILTQLNAGAPTPSGGPDSGKPAATTQAPKLEDKAH